MPNLRFLNVRFNLDAPDEQAIFKALAAYPTGARSRVVREALAAHLGIEIETEEGRANPELTRKTKALPRHGNRSQKNPKVHIVEKPSEEQFSGQKNDRESQHDALSHNAGTEHVPAEGEAESRNDKEAVKGLLSMLY